MGQDYAVDMRAAAHRHFQAAEQLYGDGLGHRKDVAAYLFGLSGECALKYMMQSAGMGPLPEAERWRDPFYAHFERLKTALRDVVSGRRSKQLRQHAEDTTLMQHWDVSMRYSHGKDIKNEWIDRWRSNAKMLVDAMDG